MNTIFPKFNQVNHIHHENQQIKLLRPFHFQYCGNHHDKNTLVHDTAFMHPTCCRYTIQKRMEICSENSFFCLYTRVFLLLYFRHIIWKFWRSFLMTSFFDDSLLQNVNTLQSALDSLNSAGSDSSVGYGNHSNNPFEYPSLTETAYPTDQFSTENHWQNAVFHNTPEHSLTQEIINLMSNTDNLLSDSDSRDTANTMIPMFQHHVHYHPPHKYFHAPSSSEHLENEHEKMHTYHTVHSAPDSSEIHHYHHLVRERKPIDISGCGSPVLSNGSYGDSGSDYLGPSSDCVDTDGDGQCDSGSGSSDSN